MAIRLMEAFPVLRASPDPLFVERCFDHFIRLLEFREAEDELAALSASPADQLTDAWAERLIQLKRDIESDRAHLNQTEHELAELAANLARGEQPGAGALRLRASPAHPVQEAITTF